MFVITRTGPGNFRLSSVLLAGVRMMTSSRHLAKVQSLGVTAIADDLSIGSVFCCEPRGAKISDAAPEQRLHLPLQSLLDAQ